MRAVITIADLPLNGAAKIGFSVRYSKEATDDGITDAGYLVHSLTQTLQHIAVEIELLDQPEKPEIGDRLIELSEAAWLVWLSIGPYLTDFPQPVAKEPRRWSRQAVLTWVRTHYPRRIDMDMAQDFIRRPALNMKGEHHDS